MLCCQPKIASIIVGYIAAADSLIIATKCFAGYNHELITLITLTNGEPPREEEYQVLNSICMTRAICNCVLFVLCMMMLYGIYQDQPSCMMPWLVTYLVVIMMDSILILASCVWVGGIYLLFYAIFICLRSFGLFIVFKYYLEASYLGDTEVEQVIEVSLSKGEQPTKTI